MRIGQKAIYNQRTRKRVEGIDTICVSENFLNKAKGMGIS